MERKDGKIMRVVKFDTYENVKRQVYDRIAGKIGKGDADDINFNVAIDALDYVDDLAEDMVYGFPNGDIYKMAQLSRRSEDFKSIFSRTAISVMDDVDDDPYSILSTVWTLLYREVLVENYIGFRDMWQKRKES